MQLLGHLGQITVVRGQHWLFLENSVVENGFKGKLRRRKLEVWKTYLKLLFYKSYQDRNPRKGPISEPTKSAFHQMYANSVGISACCNLGRASIAGILTLRFPEELCWITGFSQPKERDFVAIHLWPLPQPCALQCHLRGLTQQNAAGLYAVMVLSRLLR